MLAIDRENSKGLWAYKILDGIDIKILDEQKIDNEELNHIYYIENKNNGNRYLFAGDKSQSYTKYIGYEVGEGEVDLYKDMFKLYKSNNEFNFSFTQ